MSIIMDKYDSADENSHLRPFSFIFGFSQFIGALAVILVAIWMGRYDGGFAWRDRPEQQFHYHPLFMVIGMVFLYGEGTRGSLEMVPDDQIWSLWEIHGPFSDMAPQAWRWSLTSDIRSLSAILVYRVFRHERKIITKTAHMIMNLVVFVFFVVALKAVFDSHNLRPLPIPNMYSVSYVTTRIPISISERFFLQLHSWIGMGTILLYCCQVRGE